MLTMSISEIEREINRRTTKHSLALQMKCSTTPITAQQVATLLTAVATIMIRGFSRQFPLLLPILHSMSFRSVFVRLRWCHQTPNFLTNSIQRVWIKYSAYIVRDWSVQIMYIMYTASTTDKLITILRSR